MCPFTSLVISNIETTFLPSNTASSFSSVRMLRLFLGSWSSCLRMYSQSFLVSSVRGSGSFPTTAVSAASGCTGLLRAFLGAAAFLAVGIGQLERAGLGCQAKNQPCCPVVQRKQAVHRFLSRRQAWATRRCIKVITSFKWRSCSAEYFNRLRVCSLDKLFVGQYNVTGANAFWICVG